MRAVFLMLAGGLSLLLATSAAASIFAVKPPAFLPVEQAFALHVEPAANGETRLRWEIAPGYYLYQKRLTFKGLPEAQIPVLPEAESHYDEYFGETHIYRYSLELVLPAGAAGQVELGWQGCADAGLCYPPQTRTVSLAGAQAYSGTAVAAPVQAEDQSLASGLQAASLGWNLLIFFGLGLLLAFAPCSLPMLPILAGIVVGNQAGARRGLALAAAYVVSMSLVYAAMGVAAALLGVNLQGLMMQPWLIALFAGLFVVLALPMFGVFELQLPAALRDRLNQAGSQRQGGSFIGASALGLFSGLLVGPCMTAPLAAALLYIAQSGDALNGGLILFALGLGIGTPLVLMVTLGNRFLPKPGLWMNRVKVVFGFLFLGVAVYLLRPVVDVSLWVGLWGALLILIACALLQIAGEVQRHQAISRSGAVLSGIWGVALVLGAAGGAQDLLRPLEVFAGGQAVAQESVEVRAPLVTDLAELEQQLAQAKAAEQWVLLDYYADWCVSCKVMDKQVFAKPEVQQALQGVRMLKPDVTRTDAASRALLQRYEVMGPPTQVLIGPDGLERRAWRITGEVDAGGFLKHLNGAIGEG